MGSPEQPYHHDPLQAITMKVLPTKSRRNHACEGLQCLDERQPVGLPSSKSA